MLIIVFWCLETLSDLDYLLEQYMHLIQTTDKVQTVVNPVLSLFSMLMNLYIARLIIFNKDLHRFTYVMVAYQVNTLYVLPHTWFFLSVG